MGTRTRGAMLVFGIAAMLAGSCELSSIDPDATVTLSGRLVDDDPGPGEVVLLVEPTGSDLLVGLPVGLGSLGLTCLADDPPPPCDTRRRTTTGADGSFSFELAGRETQGAFGEVAPVRLFGQAPPRDGDVAGPLTSGRLAVRSTEVTGLDLAAWRADIEVDGGVRWDPPADLGPAAASRRTVRFLQGDRLVWLMDVPGDDAAPGPGVLEDSIGAAAVALATTGVAPFDEVEHRSELVGYRSLDGAPPSRGAPCRWLHVGGGETPVHPCPVTNGNLGTPAFPDLACPDQACVAAAVEVDLPEPTTVRQVVLRGCDTTCEVVLRAPDGTQRSAGVATSPFAVVAVTEAAPVEAITVRPTDGSHLVSLVQVSAWADLPSSGLAPHEQLGANGRPVAEGPGGDLRRAALAFAGLLVILVVAGAAWTLGRRSTRAGVED